MPETNLEQFRFEAILGIAGIISLFGFFLPWAGSPEMFLHGPEKLVGGVTFAGGWLLILASMISYDLFRSPTLQRNRPYTDSLVGIVGGVLVLLGIYLFTTAIPNDFWLENAIYVPIAGGILGIASAAALWVQEIGKSVTEKRKGGL